MAMTTDAVDGTPAKGMGQERTSKQLSTETSSEGKDFSPDKVLKAHETHSLNLDMSAAQQGTLCQGEQELRQMEQQLGVGALSSI